MRGGAVALAVPTARESESRVMSPEDSSVESSTWTRACEAPLTGRRAAGGPGVEARADRVMSPPRRVAPVTSTEADGAAAVRRPLARASTPIAPSPVGPVVSMLEPAVTTMSRAAMTSPVPVRRMCPTTTTVPVADRINDADQPCEVQVARAGRVLDPQAIGRPSEANCAGRGTVQVGRLASRSVTVQVRPP